MNTPLQNATALAGRTLLALLFVVSGFGKVTGFSGTAAYMASKGMPMTELLLVGAIAIELVGGLMLVAGFKARWAALAIFLFTIPTTIIFHNPSGLDAQAAQGQMIHLMKNLSIMGGMLLVAAFGPGAWSVDRR
jgi:putative oxidoreductase